MTEPGGLHLPLHAEMHGESGPPLLLVHGLGGNAYTWNRWVPELTRDHRVLLVDLKGFGAAPKPRGGGYGPREQADLLHRLILQQGLTDLTLVGHSMGGSIALLTALRLLADTPTRLRRLVVVAGAAYPQRLSRYLRLAAVPLLGEALLWAIPSRTLMRKGLELSYRDPSKVSASQVEAYAEPLRRPGGRYALSATTRQLIPDDTDGIVRRYCEIRVPTLLLWGAFDRVVPLWQGERLLDELPMACLEVIPDCGHMPQEERPMESLASLRRFLRESW